MMVIIQVPEVLNRASLIELRAELIGLTADQSHPDVMILEGVGENFCQGLDLQCLTAAPAVEPIVLSEVLSCFAEILLTIRRYPAATVAAVRGRALGGGLGLASACDQVVAGRSARFALPEILLGVAPAIIFPCLLERMSLQKVRLLALNPESCSAEDMRMAGLVDQVVDDAELDRTVKRCYRSLNRGESTAVSTVKSLGIDWEIYRTKVLQGVRTTEQLLQATATRNRIAMFLQGEAPWH